VVRNVIERNLTVPAAALRPAFASTAEITVAPAAFRELRQVAALQKRSFRPPLAYSYATLLLLWVLPNVRFLVARQGEAVIGCAIGDRQGRESRIINICVDPAARRRGIATRLLNELEERLPVGDIVLMVEDQNSGAKALYSGEGYNPTGVSRDYYGRGKDGVWMQKQRTAGATPRLRT
jgi:[ribosomal protein S18]-alanine N-acetyltransferase